MPSTSSTDQRLSQEPTTSARLPVAWGPAASAVGIAGFGLSAAASAGALVLLSMLTGEEQPGQSLELALLSTLVLQIGMLAVAFVVGPWRRAPAEQLFGFRHLSVGVLLGWAAAALFGSILVSAIYTTVAGGISEDLVPTPLPPGLDFRDAWILSFVSVVLIAPFAEEVFFRGFLFAGLAKRYGFWVGALVSAVLFGLIHFELARTVPALLSGVVFAAVYWRSRSLWPCVVAHTTQNAVAFGVGL